MNFAIYDYESRYFRNHIDCCVIINNFSENGWVLEKIEHSTGDGYVYFKRLKQKAKLF